MMHQVSWKIPRRGIQRFIPMLFDSENMSNTEDFEKMVDAYIDIFGNRWNILIINEILIGSKRFNEIKHALEPISQTVLVRHLRQLEDYGILSRKVVCESPIEVRYSLTPEGVELYTPMLESFKWIIRNILEKDDGTMQT